MDDLIRVHAAWETYLNGYLSLEDFHRTMMSTGVFADKHVHGKVPAVPVWVDSEQRSKNGESCD